MIGAPKVNTGPMGSAPAPHLPRIGRWRFHGDAPTHFTVSLGDGSPFKVAKKGLHPGLLKHIQGLAKGGEVKDVQGFADGTVDAPAADAGVSEQPADQSHINPSSLEILDIPNKYQSYLANQAPGLTPMPIDEFAKLVAEAPAKEAERQAAEAIENAPPVGAAAMAARLQGPTSSGEPVGTPDVAPVANVPPGAPEPTPAEIAQATKAAVSSAGVGLPKMPGLGVTKPIGAIPGIAGQKDAIDSLAEIAGEKAFDESIVRERQSKEIAAKNELFDQQVAKNKAQQDHVLENMRDIDPNRFMNNLGPERQALAVIGQALGAYASSMTHSPNFAMETIQNAINRDINSQQANLGKQQSLLSYYIGQGHDLQSARQMAIATLDRKYGDSIARIGLNAASDEAKAGAAKLKGMLDENAFKTTSEISDRRASRDVQRYMAQLAGAEAPYKMALLQSEVAKNLGAANKKGTDSSVRDAVARGYAQLDPADVARAFDKDHRYVEPSPGRFSLAKTTDTAKKYTDVQDMSRDIVNDIGEIRRFIEKYPHGGIPLVDSEDRAAVESVVARMTGTIKNKQAKTGAATTPVEMAWLINPQIAQPTKMLTLMSTNKALLNALERAQNQSMQLAAKNYLVNAGGVPSGELPTLKTATDN